jgi:DNA-binding transcriptional regulator YiaG
MPNIATVFKAEITRLARKELRGNSDALGKSVSAQRSEIAQLKRRVQALEALVQRLARSAAAADARPRATAPASPDEADAAGLRFRAKGMAANRQRLGLSAADFGLLVGATGQSIYAWEAGKTKPRPQALAAIAALRGIGKREAEARLKQLKG